MAVTLSSPSRARTFLAMHVRGTGEPRTSKGRPGLTPDGHLKQLPAHGESARTSSSVRPFGRNGRHGTPLPSVAHHALAGIAAGELRAMSRCFVFMPAMSTADRGTFAVSTKFFLQESCITRKCLIRRTKLFSQYFWFGDNSVVSICSRVANVASDG